ncbi:DCN1-like protein 3 [Saccoglossus kowalevskii]|uniref:Defective in cullin neddylation protein n=1 Tax=Saccoglossus kowalevskii TaxID=10224 RepID=A0ABM0MP72_SACKO|nr:PREDICTED: DCN1-like protein 3-like isoform X1 [Saccoglossus kowalevskii]XP_006821814.1 PREDICTED: DCN1-like protein 3-like isoform X2 [Saccoglossus kowalevskii]
MGKCLSSCSEPSPAEQNGGPKRTEQTHYQAPMTTVPTHPAPAPIRESLSSVQSSGMEYYQNGSHKRLEKTKMPPIRKTSNGVDSGRRSFVPKTECSESKINRLFDHYKDEDEDCILAEGTEKFCHDLCVDPTEFIVLVLACKFQAATMCQFTRKEFLYGCKSLKVDSIKGIQTKFPEMLEEVQNEAKFKDLYRFTFTFGLDMDGGQRSLPCDIAIPLWKLVFSHREPAILERWINFLQENQIRGISKDTWNMFLNFTEVVGADFTGYDDSEAWPSLFDDFVEYELEKEKALQNGKRTDDRNLPVYYS